jgi:hypothetical protein
MVRPVSGSRPVDVSYSDRVRTDAQRIVTALADSVINFNLDRRFQTPTRRVYGTSGARLSHVHLYATASGRSLQESRTKYAKAGLMPPSSRMEAKSMEPKWQPQLPRDCVRYPALWVRTRTAPPWKPANSAFLRLNLDAAVIDEAAASLSGESSSGSPLRACPQPGFEDRSAFSWRAASAPRMPKVSPPTFGPACPCMSLHWSGTLTMGWAASGGPRGDDA